VCLLSDGPEAEVSSHHSIFPLDVAHHTKEPTRHSGTTTKEKYTDISMTTNPPAGAPAGGIWYVINQSINQSRGVFIMCLSKDNKRLTTISIVAWIAFCSMTQGKEQLRWKQHERCGVCRLSLFLHSWSLDSLLPIR
jgi:hypothetical protein